MSDFKRSAWLGVLLLTMSAVVPPGAGAQEAEGLRKITKKVAPLYPQLALQRRLTGTVKLVALVTPAGTVKSVRTIGGNAVLATAAENAVKQWTYEVSTKESSESVAVKFVGPQ